MDNVENESVKCSSPLKNKTNVNMIDVIIAGGGIGGLVSALSLHRCGISVRVYEQASSLEPIGFGVNLQPYSIKYLYELGLEDELNKIGVRTRKVNFYSRNGQFIFEDIRGLDAGFNWPMYSIHRGYLHKILLDHLRNKIGENFLQLNQKLITFRSQLDYVEVDFINPITGKITTEYSKLLIGADGINSTVRKILYPDEGAPLWEGLKIWRGITPVDKMYLDGRTMLCAGNPNELFLVIFPLNNNLINWACVVRIEESKTYSLSIAPDWNNSGRIDDLLPLISKMHLDCIDINKLIKSSIAVNEFPVSDRNNLSQWTFDRVTLVGDAAHPMYPNGGNGASQAILDARGLAICFREYGATPEALKAYDNLRRPAADRFVLAARQYGPDKVLRIIDERSSNKFQQLSDIISTSEIQNIISDYKQLSGWNVSKLNEEPSVF